MRKSPKKNRFSPVFWIANFMELLERWAYYGVFALLSVYLTDPKSTGGLGFTSGQSGTLMAVVTFTIYFFPMFAGAIADRLGYRKVLLFAFSILAVGYILMGQFSSYHGVFLAFLLVGVGAALFKPVIVGTVSKTTNPSNDTVGFGIFYMIVNIGAFIGPFVASKLRDVDWHYIFVMSSAIIAVNFLPLIFLYKEPGRKADLSEDRLSEKLMEILRNFFKVLSDFKFLIFVLIMSGFWVMYMQIFFTLPVYITQWIDTTVIYNSSSWLAWAIGTTKGGIGVINPEMIQNLGAASIVLFQVIMSNLVKGVVPIRSITTGILISALAMGAMSLGMSGWVIVVAIVFFSFGEMISSPRTQEYVSRIAPEGQVGVYMGFSFLPMAFGNLIGGFLYGRLYSEMSDLYTCISKELIVKGLGTSELLNTMEKSEIMKVGMERLNMDAPQLKSYLFVVYEPFRIWWVFGAIGLLTVVMFLFYNRWLRKKSQSEEDQDISSPRQKVQVP